MSIFEAIMLICFGSAWPASIYKSWKSRTAKGQSLFFMIIINIGYVSGAINTILHNPNFIIILYIINFIMVSINIILFLRNRRFDKEAEENISLEKKPPQ